MEMEFQQRTGRKTMTAREMSAFIKIELETELGLAIQDTTAHDFDEEEFLRARRVYAEGYAIVGTPLGSGTWDEAQDKRLEELGWSERDRHAVAGVLKFYCLPGGGRAALEQRLQEMGIDASPVALETAQCLRFRAREQAQHLAMRFVEPRVRDSINPVETLLKLADAPPSPVSPVVPPVAPAVASAVEPESLFVINHPMRLSEVANQVCDDLVQSKRWREPASQQRRIVQSFIWMTGDKPVGAYTQTDVSQFKRDLIKLPCDFRPKTYWDQPFAQVLAQLGPVESGKERSQKTINRDLSTMSSFVAGMQAAGYWKPRIQNGGLDFATLQDAVSESEDGGRVPWTEQHLQKIFSSPIWLGNAGPHKRLIEAEYIGRNVYQDAAYWVLILIYYTLGCRDEICGLLLEDVHLDEPVPYITIQNNSLRLLKRRARNREIPVHPEILRLGFDKYVRKLRAAGETILFPELYMLAGKKGGDQFYPRAWVHISNWLAARMSIPLAANDKEADIHSIRTFGASILDQSAVNQNIVKDIMGHARTGVTATKYQKRTLALGMQSTLGERLSVLMLLPNVTEGIHAQADVNLLPMALRSRVGQERARKKRVSSSTASRIGPGGGSDASKDTRP